VAFFGHLLLELYLAAIFRLAICLLLSHVGNAPIIALHPLSSASIGTMMKEADLFSWDRQRERRRRSRVWSAMRPRASRTNIRTKTTASIELDRIIAVEMHALLKKGGAQ